MAPDVAAICTAVVPALPFQPRIVPFRVSKMKVAGVPFTGNDPATLLNTIPVGPLGGAPPGMVTTNPWGVPAALYRVASPVPWSEVQKGDVAEKATPHGFLRLGSVLAARPGISETRLVWL